jgi:hypothetical protein
MGVVHGPLDRPMEIETRRFRMLTNPSRIVICILRTSSFVFSAHHHLHSPHIVICMNDSFA